MIHAPARADSERCPLLELLERSFARHAAEPAVRISGGAPLRYSELAALVDQRQEELSDVPSGEVIAITHPGPIETIVELLAAMRSSRPALLADCSTDSSTAPLLARGDLAPDTALIALTSGSTGTPRAIEFTSAALAANVRALHRYRAEGPGVRQLILVPLHHLYGLVAGLLVPLTGGAEVVLPASPLPNRVVEAIRSERVTHVLTVPSWAEAILAELTRLDRPESSDPLGPQLRSICIGGAALSPRTAQAFVARGIPIEVGYGLTEAGVVVSVGECSSMPRGAVGRPLEGIEVRIGAGGEIEVRTSSAMTGCLGDPRATAAMLSEGWLATGDVGALDRDGFLFVDGRRKEMLVTSGGESIDPTEIEVHYADPSFAEHCVVGLPDRAGNDRPVLVVRRAGEAAATPLTNWVVERRSALPDRWHIAEAIETIEPFPRTAAGKIRRRELAARLRTALSADSPRDEEGGRDDR